MALLDGLYSLDPLQPALQNGGVAETQNGQRKRISYSTYIAIDVDTKDEHLVLAAARYQKSVQQEYKDLQQKWCSKRQDTYGERDALVVARDDRELFAVLREGSLLSARGAARYYATDSRPSGIIAGEGLGVLITDDSKCLVKALRTWVSPGSN